MIGDIGRYALLLASIVLILMIFSNLYAAKTAKKFFVKSGQIATLAVLALSSIASLALILLLVQGDFRYAYVADYTSRDLGILYRITAFWGGNQGSLLLWFWLLTLYTVMITFSKYEGRQQLQPYVTAILGVVSLFFSIVLNVVTPPFELLPYSQLDGAGLNPLLQNPGMTIHPLTLYLGYIGFSIPFAFGIAALLTGRADAAWLRITRRWSLVSWLFLSMGIIYGARWSYEVLGWGGYWSWDPVENASLIPWLTATAFIHSAIVQERKGLLKRWNIFLVILTFSLTIFGTFLTRSGVFWSVHAFSNGALGAYFLAFLGVIFLASFGLLILRWNRLAVTTKSIAMVSKESSFVLNNVFFVSMAFTVLWGTVFPVISQAFAGHQVVVGPGFFNTVIVPLGLAVVLLMGIGTVLAWRKSTLRKLSMQVLWPLVGTCIVVFIMFGLGVRKWTGLLAFASIIFVLLIIMLEFAHGIMLRMNRYKEPLLAAIYNLLKRQRRRYGGYIVHLAILFIVMGISVSSTYGSESQVVMTPGQRVSIGTYQLQLLNLATRPEYGNDVVYSQLLVKDDAKTIGIMQPEVWYFLNGSLPAPQAAIKSTPIDDLYIVMAGMDAGKKSVVLEIHYSPMLGWIWYGGYLLVFGTLMSLWPESRPKLEKAKISKLKRMGATV